MGQEIGKQYSKDKVRDRSGFLAKARLQQSTYRAEVLDVTYDVFGNYLTKSDAEKGLNFYKDTFKEVTNRFPDYDKVVYANMLNSGSVAFNFFAPLKKDLKLAQVVLNQFLVTKIDTISKIDFAYAPSPTNRYLDDETVFDVFVEYTDILKKNCVLGISINYTENNFKLKANSKEALALKDAKSRYNLVTTNCGIFEVETIGSLADDTFRQLWKTQLLGERILFKDAEKYSRFTSLVISPEGNARFTQTCKDYAALLINPKDRFKAIRFEDFISACQEHKADSDWTTYLSDRFVST